LILSHTSTFSTLTELLAGIERTFGDPDWERTACCNMQECMLQGSEVENQPVFEKSLLLRQLLEQ